MSVLINRLRALWRGLQFVGWRVAWRSMLYRGRQLFYAYRFPPSSPHHDIPMHNVTRYTIDETAITLWCGDALLHISAPAAGQWRLRLRADHELPPYLSYATLEQGAPLPLAVEEKEDMLLVQTGEWQLRIRREPLAWQFCLTDGQELGGWMQPRGWTQGKGRLEGEFGPGAHFYGLGERAFPLALQGRQYTLTTQDPEIYEPGHDPLYINIPFVICQEREGAYGMLFDSMADGVLDLGESTAQRWFYETENEELRLDYVAGPRVADVVERYTALTGRMPLPPLWALGYHQSRWSYESAEEVREIARQFRQRRIPCEAIHFDIDYMDGFRCFTWDKKAFPDPPGLLAELHEQGFKAVGMIDPGIKADPDYWVCAEGLAKDMFCKLPDGSLFHGPVWPGECYFPDFSDPRVREWWGGLYQNLLAAGFDGFWNDMNEPTVFPGATFPPSVQHNFEGRGADHAHLHSGYGMQMIRATYEGLNRLRPGLRNWVFSRSGYAGIQRYGSSWTADNTSTWAHLRLTPAMLLNLGLSGLSFTGPDVGGFGGDAEPELFARWISMGAFTPFYRTHTAKGTARQEPWSFGPEVEAIARQYIGWRYRLLPYLYTTFWQCSQQGTPIMRPMFYDQDDPQPWLAMDDQWLLGDHLLVAPVLEPGADARDVWLPKGTWYDFWTDEQHKGPARVRKEAPLDVVPVFVRAGAVLPLAPVRQSTATPLSSYELHVYAGESESWLYEDDGLSLDYQNGHYRLTHFRTFYDAEGKLHISRQSKGSYQPQAEAEKIIVHGAPGSPIWSDIPSELP